MKDAHEKFSWVTVSFHWIIGLAFIAMLVFGLYIESMPRGPEKGMLVGLHKSFGVLILIAAFSRIIWRFFNKFPKPISNVPNWQRISAKISHWVLICATVIMPVSGIMMTVGAGYSVGVFGVELIAGSGETNEVLRNIGGATHGLGGRLIILFVILHFLGAMKHQFFDKDGTLLRMLGFRINKGKA